MVFCCSPQDTCRMCPSCLPWFQMWFLMPLDLRDERSWVLTVGFQLSYCKSFPLNHLRLFLNCWTTLVIFHKMVNLTPSLLVNEPFHDSVPNHGTVTWDRGACSPVEKQVFLGHSSTSTLYVVPVPTCACAFLTPKHCAAEIPCYRSHYSSILNFRHLEILVWILDGVPLKGQTKPQWKQCTDGTDVFIGALSLRTVQKAEQQEIERQNALRALWMSHSTEAPFFSGERIYCATICLS